MNDLERHDIEERCLSIILANPELADAENFSRPFTGARHKLADLLAGMRVEGAALDPQIISTRDVEAGKLASKLTAVKPPKTLYRELRGTLDELEIRRRASKALEAAHAACYTDAPIDDVLSTVEGAVLSIKPCGKAEAAGDVYSEILRRVEWRAANPGKVRGIEFSSGDFERLEAMMDGLHGGEMVVIGARPSVGKTALALCIAHNLATSNQRVMFFSLEMTRVAIAERRLALAARTATRKESCSWSSAELQKLARAAGPLARDKNLIIDDANLSVHGIIQRARRAVRQDGVTCIVVDYLQLVRAGERYRGDRRNEVGEVSNRLKALAKELDVPVVVLAQLRRMEAKYDASKGDWTSAPPRLEDLKESGDIEQDADAVWLLHRVVQGDTIGDAELIVAKQRNGPTGKVSLAYDPPTYHFSEKKEAV